MIRFGIVGAGTIGRRYIDFFRQQRVAGARLAAICDVDPGAALLTRDCGARFFQDAGDLYASGAVDAVMVTTPALFRASLVEGAIAHGLGVIADKPIGRHLLEAQRLAPSVAAHGRPVAVMFNQRTDPGFRRIRQLLESAALGRIVRVNWYVSHYFRTDAYYRHTPWRGTWAGEGGGVLMNQCHHQLDILAWLFGLPTRVHAFARFGRRDGTDVEDSVVAHMDLADGGEASFIASTREFPLRDRLEIVGTRGAVVKDYQSLEITSFSCDTDAFIAASTDPSSRVVPQACTVRETCVSKGGQHLEVIQNFVDAWQDGRPLIAGWADGVDALHLANALLLSALTGAEVALPLDGASYADAVGMRLRPLQPRQASAGCA